MGALKVKEFPGLQRIAREPIEKHEMEQSLRDAQFALERVSAPGKQASAGIFGPRGRDHHSLK